jgi:large subunit ribosomal protein L28
MARVCQYSGKRTRAGRQYTTRGLAKAKGGVGKKTTGKTKRVFKPNIQKVRAMVDGRVVRVKIAAKYLRRGVIEKPLPRNYKPAAPAAE